MSTTEITNRTDFIQIDLVEVGENPRKKIDEASFVEFAANVKKYGVTTPITVTPNDDGDGFILISGQRRLRAAKEAGLDVIPALIIDPAKAEGQLHEMAVSENLHRDPLTTMEEALAFGEARDRMTVEQIATAYSVSEATVRDRLALLALPASMHESVDKGIIPIAAARTLAQIAAQSSVIAEGIGKKIDAEEIDASELVRSPSYVVHRVLENPAKGAERFFAFDVRTARLEKDELEGFIPEEQLAPLLEQAKAFSERSWSPLLTAEDIDAANAFGALLRIKDPSGSKEDQFVTDPVWLMEFLPERIAARANEVQEAAAARGERVKGPASESVKEQLAAQRQKEKDDRDTAIKQNLDTGTAISTKFQAQFDKNTMRLLALLVFDKYRELAGRGVRFTDPTLHTEEKGKVKYVSKDDAMVAWRKKLDRLKTPEEILDHMIVLFVAAYSANQEAVARSARMNVDIPRDEEIEKLLERLCKFLPAPVKARLAEEAAARQAERERWAALRSGSPVSDEDDDEDPEDGDTADLL